ncbi:MAG: carboxypeptidase-like regulatory domain-containing protein, partial [Firmicutes bacterium]|nr:carboxypeptidase-like regulatory domain-containing protein [Bacillota bacterium]
MDKGKWSRWGLVAVLLGMMVAMAGCFGGGPIPTGGIGGIVCVPIGDDASPIHLLEKGLETIPVGYRALGYATIKIAGRTVKTNSNGYFELWDIPQGKRLIEITHGSYQPYSTYVTIYADRLEWLSPVKLGVGYYLLVGAGEFGFEGADSLEDGPRNDVSAMELAL